MNLIFDYFFFFLCFNTERQNHPIGLFAGIMFNMFIWEEKLYSCYLLLFSYPLLSVYKYMKIYVFVCISLMGFKTTEWIWFQFSVDFFQIFSNTLLKLAKCSCEAWIFLIEFPPVIKVKFRKNLIYNSIYMKIGSQITFCIDYHKYN